MQKKSIIEVIITIVLIFVLFAVIKAVRTKKQTRPAGAKPVATMSVEGLVSEDRGIFRRLEEETKDLKLKRDPFVYSPITPKEVSSDLRLTGIVWDRENPKAIINDFILGKGDSIGEHTIVDIKQDRVILNAGAGNFEIRLGH